MFLFEFPITLVGGSLPGLQRLVVVSTRLTEEMIPPDTNGQLDWEEDLVLLASQGEGPWTHNGTQ
jgi:hypothetical protein